MVQLNLVEEDRFAGDRVRSDGGGSLANAQPITVLPFVLGAALGAQAVDLSPVVGLKELLPAHVQPGEIADIRQSLGSQPLEYRRIEALGHHPAVGERGLPTLLRSNQTAEG